MPCPSAGRVDDDRATPAVTPMHGIARSIPRRMCRVTSLPHIAARPLVLKGTGLRPQISAAPASYATVMTYVISSACVDVMHKSCVQECPVDCIYEGARSLYINPEECGIAARANWPARPTRSTTKPICPRTSSGISPTMPHSSATYCRAEIARLVRPAALTNWGWA